MQRRGAVAVSESVAGVLCGLRSSVERAVANDEVAKGIYIYIYMYIYIYICMCIYIYMYIYIYIYCRDIPSHIW